jgi:lipocalin-like protein
MEESMRRILGICSVAALGCFLLTSSSFAQQKSLKEQMVGAWTLVSVTTKLPDGSPAWGANPTGLMIFTDNGRYSLHIIRSDLPKFASNNRTKGTPEEYKAVVHGSISNFGTYTINEVNKTFTIRYDGSTFPNRIGKEDTRPIVVEGDELRLTNPAPTTGAEPSQLVFRRVK